MFTVVTGISLKSMAKGVNNAARDFRFSFTDRAGSVDDGRYSFNAEASFVTADPDGLQGHDDVVIGQDILRFAFNPILNKVPEDVLNMPAQLQVADLMGNEQVLAAKEQSEALQAIQAASQAEAVNKAVAKALESELSIHHAEIEAVKDQADAEHQIAMTHHEEAKDFAIAEALQANFNTHQAEVNCLEAQIRRLQMRDICAMCLESEATGGFLHGSRLAISSSEAYVCQLHDFASSFDCF